MTRRNFATVPWKIHPARLGACVHIYITCATKIRRALGFNKKSVVLSELFKAWWTCLALKRVKMELIFEFLLELLIQIFFTDVLLKLLYHLTIRPIVVMVGYLSFSVEKMDGRTLNAKNALSWNKLESIGWQSLTGFLGIILLILTLFILLLFLK